jgi:hypothetical protein
MYEHFENRGSVYVVFIKEIKDDSKLINLVRLSGFKSLYEWIKKAEGSRFLYYVWLYKYGI